VSFPHPFLTSPLNLAGGMFLFDFPGTHIPGRGAVVSLFHWGSVCAATAEVAVGWPGDRQGDSNGCGGLLQRVREGCQGCAVPCLDGLNVEHLLRPCG